MVHIFLLLTVVKIASQHFVVMEVVMEVVLVVIISRQFGNHSRLCVVSNCSFTDHTGFIRRRWWWLLQLSLAS